MKRTPLRRKTHLRSIGAKTKRLRPGWDASKKIVLIRAGGRCENPWCRRATRLDVHHIVKRSQGRDDSPLNLVALCRTCHARTDLAGPNRLEIQTFVDGLERTYIRFMDVSKPAPARSAPLEEIP